MYEENSMFAVIGLFAVTVFTAQLRPTKKAGNVQRTAHDRTDTDRSHRDLIKDETN